MNKTPTTKKELRTRRHTRIRARVKGTAARPRLTVFKSNRYLSAQLIDDDARRTLLSVSGKTLGGTPSAQAEGVGATLAEKAKALKVESVVFDRSGYRYAGQIKALAEAARSGGLSF